MEDIYAGQIMMTGFDFAPLDFALCDGQTLPIAQYQALFSLLHFTYGGNGGTNFMLPDLRGRTAIGLGNDGAVHRGGEERVALSIAQMPEHAHAAIAVPTDARTRSPAGAFYSKPAQNIYGPAAHGPLVDLNALTLAASGDNQPHDNLQPSQVISFAIALQGEYPSRP